MPLARSDNLPHVGNQVEHIIRLGLPPGHKKVRVAVADLDIAATFTF